MIWLHAFRYLGTSYWNTTDIKYPSFWCWSLNNQNIGQSAQSSLQLSSEGRSWEFTCSMCLCDGKRVYVAEVFQSVFDWISVVPWVCPTLFVSEFLTERNYSGTVELFHGGKRSFHVFVFLYFCIILISLSSCFLL